ncbi:MAG: PHP-associated domain-containing protein [Candidatus Micrarchaeota archaeon]
MPTVTMDLHSHQFERKVKSRDYWREADKRGIDVMAITEHTHFDAKKSFDVLLAEKPRNKILVPGLELNSSIGHTLCLAPTPEIYSEKKLFEFGVDIETASDIAKKHGALLVAAHPWGYQHDSAAFLVGPKQVLKLMRRLNLGIEAYNGMVGHLSDIIYDSAWVRKPFNFLAFLEKNKFTRTVGLGRIGGRLKKNMDASIWNTLARVSAGTELGEKASFITAGSDAHTADRVGEGMMKISADEELKTPFDVLELIQQKKRMVWCGVGVEEIRPGVYKKIKRSNITGSEIWDGIKYATKRTVTEKVWKKIRRNKKAGTKEAAE